MLKESKDVAANPTDETKPTVAVKVSTAETSDLGTLLLWVGLGIAAYGLYNLFYPVSEQPQGMLQIANLHKLFIGSTLTIVGTMLSLAGAKSCKMIH